MYNEDDLQAAVAAGILSADAADAFRAHVDARRTTSLVDEEHFRLITGFNDIFVSIAAVLLLFAVGAIGGVAGNGMGAALVAAVSWALAEYFTRQRRMALPSILLLLSFVGGVFFAALAFAGGPVHGMMMRATGSTDMTGFAIAGGLSALAAWLHWRRFRVPITVAAGASALVGTLLALFLLAVPVATNWLSWLLLGAGLGVFSLAMWWDMGDRARQTRRSDVAFWLHLLAAPMIAHPIFWAVGLFSPAGDVVLKSAGVIILYLAFGLVALAVDRRALLVSALGYVLYAISLLIKQAGGVGLNFALTALVIGSALLLLSALWHRARVAVVSCLPDYWQVRLPQVDRSSATTPPAS